MLLLLGVKMVWRSTRRFARRIWRLYVADGSLSERIQDAEAQP